MTCERCGDPIPPERLEAIPGTRRCVSCSDTRPKLCLLEYGHKTAGYAVVVDTNRPGSDEQVRLAMRAYRRAR